MARKGPVVESSHPIDALLEEDRIGDQSADDVLFLTYNLDTAFFETRLLGLCQATGAATTVVADGRIWDPDPRSLIAAGRTYHLGLAVGAGVFHPKLMVISGPERATIAIGSGNLTPGGWQYNAELSTVIRARNGACPVVVQQIAEWLSRLPEFVNLDVRSCAIMARVSRQLIALAERSEPLETGHRLVHNLDAAIIKQLPQESVDMLRLYAPFHDPRSRAVAQIIRRLTPKRLSLAVQPGYTVIDAKSLKTVLSKAHCQWVVQADSEDLDDAGRYRHGKLIEWRTGRTLHALTGSPNLSTAALLSTVSEGNCEVGIISRVENSLFPSGIAISLESVPTKTIAARHVEDGSPVGALPFLLGATIQDGKLFVELSSPAPEGLVLEYSAREQPPEVWADSVELPGDVTEVLIDLRTEAGSRIRLTWTSPDGSILVGPVLPVADPEQTERHWRDGASRVGSKFARGGWAALDLAGLTYLHRELLELTRQLENSRPPRLTDADEVLEVGRSRTMAKDSDVEPWLWSENAEELMAEHLRTFALGLPAITGTHDVSVPAWARGTEITEVAAEDDEVIDENIVAEIESAGEENPGRRSHRGDEASLRKRRRDWCRKLADIENDLPLPAQLAALRVVLALYCAGNWDNSEQEQEHAFDLIYDMIEGLDVTGGTAPQKASAASLAGVGISILRERISFAVHTEFTISFDALAESLSSVLDLAEDAKIEEYSRHLTNVHDGPLDPDFVRETIKSITARDTLANLVAGVQELSWEIVRHGQSAVEIEGSFVNPTDALLRSLTMIDERFPVAIRTQGSKRWAAAVWLPPDFYLVDPGRAGQRWRHWRLEGLIGPSAFATQMRDEDGPARSPIDHGPWVNPIPAAQSAFERLGLPLD